MGRNPASPPPTDGPAKLREGIGSLESCPMMVIVVQFPDSGKRMLMKTEMHGCKEKRKTYLRINMVFSVITQRILPSAHWLWWWGWGAGRDEELACFAILDELGFS